MIRVLGDTVKNELIFFNAYDGASEVCSFSKFWERGAGDLRFNLQYELGSVWI